MPRIEHTLDQPNREPGAACLGFRGRCSQSRYALLRRWRTAGLPNCNTHRARPIWPDEPLRGAYGTAIANHPSGTQFARLDGSAGRFAYPNSLIGQTIYLKFASMNIVGGDLQSFLHIRIRSKGPVRPPRLSSLARLAEGRRQTSFFRAMYSQLRRPIGACRQSRNRGNGSGRDDDIQHPEETAQVSKA